MVATGAPAPDEVEGLPLLLLVTVVVVLLRRVACTVLRAEPPKPGSLDLDARGAGPSSLQEWVRLFQTPTDGECNRWLRTTLKLYTTYTPIAQCKPTCSCA